MLSGFQRRIGVKDLAVGTLVVLGQVVEILVQRLAIDRQRFSPRFRNRGDARGSRDVHHIERGAGHAFGEP